MPSFCPHLQQYYKYFLSILILAPAIHAMEISTIAGTLSSAMHDEDNETYLQKKMAEYAHPNDSIRGLKQSYLHKAADAEDIPFLKALLIKGPTCFATTIDEMDALQSWTPLHYGVYRGNIEVVKLLLAHGANPDPYIDGMCAMISGYQPPIDIARDEGHSDILDLLAELLPPKI